MMTIDELLIDFDEMGFVPTTLCENPDDYAQDWKKQLVAEIERLKAENVRLTAKLGQVLLSIDTVKEMNAMCNITEQRKCAVQDFAEKAKAKSEMFLVAKGDGVYAEKPYVSVEQIEKLLEDMNDGND